MFFFHLRYQVLHKNRQGKLGPDLLVPLVVLLIVGLVGYQASTGLEYMDDQYSQFMVPNRPGLLALKEMPKSEDSPEVQLLRQTLPRCGETFRYKHQLYALAGQIVVSDNEWGREFVKFSQSRYRELQDYRFVFFPDEAALEAHLDAKDYPKRDFEKRETEHTCAGIFFASPTEYTLRLPSQLEDTNHVVEGSLNLNEAAFAALNQLHDGIQDLNAEDSAEDEQLSAKTAQARKLVLQAKASTRHLIASERKQLDTPLTGLLWYQASGYVSWQGIIERFLVSLSTTSDGLGELHPVWAKKMPTLASPGTTISAQMARPLALLVSFAWSVSYVFAGLALMEQRLMGTIHLVKLGGFQPWKSHASILLAHGWVHLLILSPMMGFTLYFSGLATNTSWWCIQLLMGSYMWASYLMILRLSPLFDRKASFISSLFAIICLLGFLAVSPQILPGFLEKTLRGLPFFGFNQVFQKLLENEAKGLGTSFGELAGLLVPLFLGCLLFLSPALWTCVRPWVLKRLAEQKLPQKPTPRVSLEDQLNPEDSQGVCVHRLTKFYVGRPKASLSDFSVALQAGECITVLGKNGAGKSTFLNLLAGKFAPTSGHISYFGSAQLPMLGIVEQANIYFPFLTVEEHFHLFHLLKQSPEPVSSVARGVEASIKLTDLEKVRHNLAGNLSGGELRRLCLGMAFAGLEQNKPGLVVVDEPSSGLDPDSRKKLWDLIRGYRRLFSQLHILISTHYMDEAEELGDRILIIHEGQKVVLGTAQQLKRSYDSGYRVTIKLKKGASNGQTRALVNFLETWEISNPSIILPEILGIFPYSRQRQLPDFLEGLKAQEGVEHVGVFSIPIEDVFMSITQVDVSKVGLPPLDEPEPPRYTQFEAYFKIRWLITVREPFAIRFQLLPVLIVFLAVFLPTALVTQPPSLEVTMSNLYGSQGFEPTPLTVGLMGSPGWKPTAHWKHKLVDDFVVPLDRENQLQANVQGFLQSMAEDNSPNGLQSLVGDVTLFDADFQNEILFRGLKAPQMGALLMGQPLIPEDPPFYLFYANTTSDHSLPAILTALTEIQTGVQLKGHNHPFPTPNNVMHLQDKLLMVVVGNAVALALGALGLNIAQAIIYQWETGSRFQHFLGGGGHLYYWLANLMVDFLMSGVSVGLVIGVVGAFGVPLFNWENENGRFLLECLLTFLPAHIGLVYLLSHCVKPNAAQGALNISFMSAAALYFVAILFLGLRAVNLELFQPQLDCDEVTLGHPYETCNFIVIHWIESYSRKVLLYLPVFALTYSINIGQAVLSSNALFSTHFSSYLGKWGGQTLHALRVSAWTYLLGAILLEVACRYPAKASRLFFWRKCRRVQEDAHSLWELRGDVSVKVENERALTEVYALDESPAPLVVCGLTKRYPEIRAVDHVSLVCEAGETLCLLGANGAGKSSLIKMITGIEPPTSGHCRVNSGGAKGAKGLMGYCSQFGALYSNLTVGEHVRFYVTLRGYSNVEPICLAFIDVFQLTDFINHKIDQLSGGTQRKVSTLIAFIGFPRFTLLDEPSCGLDPVARRVLWKIIHNVKEQKKSALLLSTHSMEEAENLADRVCIMSLGNLRTIGSLEMVRAIYGLRYRVTLEDPSSEKLGVARDTLLKDYALVGEITEKTQRLEFLVNAEGVSFESLVRRLQALQDQGEFSNYLLDETNLEEIFHNINQG